MTREKKIMQINFDEEFLYDCAEKKYQEGDYLGALQMLARRNERYAPAADAFALAADIYEALELHSMCADSWYRFLDTCAEADFAEGYEGLAVAFMNMDDALEAARCYRLALEADGAEELPFDLDEAFREEPKLRFVRSDEEEASFTVAQGVAQMKSGDLEGARASFLSVSEESEEYASAAGLAAMCLLLSGDEESAEKECAALYERYPDNVQTLTTYCAVLGGRGNKEGALEVAKKLAAIDLTSTEDIYRAATAMCETGLHEEAFRLLEKLKDGQLRYDENVLYFYAVAAANTGRREEAISALERLTTLYPRKAVAQYYLERLRAAEEKDEVKMNYFYRLPQEEYRAVADYFLHLNKSRGDADAQEFERNFRLAFDELEGRDVKIQLLASKEAVALGADAPLREVLLDYNGDDLVKISILHDLTVRNEEDSFGVVLNNRYQEFFTHHLELGQKKKGAFLKAFADVYTKFILIERGNRELNEDKLCDAAEDIYESLAEAGAWELFDARAALSAAIYREARLQGGVRGVEKIAKTFNAEKSDVCAVLDYLI